MRPPCRFSIPQTSAPRSPPVFCILDTSNSVLHTRDSTPCAPFRRAQTSHLPAVTGRGCSVGETAAAPNWNSAPYSDRYRLLLHCRRQVDTLEKHRLHHLYHQHMHKHSYLRVHSTPTHSAAAPTTPAPCSTPRAAPRRDKCYYNELLPSNS